MTSFSRNFIIHALPFLKHDFRTKSIPEVSAILATSSSFINGSLAPEMMMKLSPEFDNDGGRIIIPYRYYTDPELEFPVSRVLNLLREFSSTLQFVTELTFHQNFLNKKFLPLFFNDLIHKTRYFSRQLTRLDALTQTFFRSSSSLDSSLFSCLFPLLRALRSLSFKFELRTPQHERDLVGALKHLDLDELGIGLTGSLQSSDILHQIWDSNPMSRLRRLRLKLSCLEPQSICLKAISDFHPNLSCLCLDTSVGINAYPDLSAMNQLNELEICGDSFCDRYRDNNWCPPLSSFFGSPPPHSAEGLLTYCNSLTSLTLSHVQFGGNAYVDFFVQNCGSADMMRKLRLKDEYNHSCTSTLRAGVGFSELVIMRYPLLEELVLYSDYLVTDRHLQLIGQTMSNVKALLLPTQIRGDALPADQSPCSAKSLSWIFDPSKSSEEQQFPVSSLETLSLPGVKFGVDDHDLKSVFGSSSIVDGRRYCLKSLNALYANFVNVNAFLSFIKHFTETIQDITLPEILNGDDDDAESSALRTEKHEALLPLMRNLHSLNLEWSHVQHGPAQALAVGAIVKTTPHLRNFSIIDIHETPASLHQLHPECPGLIHLFEMLQQHLVQDPERSYLSIELRSRVSAAMPHGAWLAMNRTKSLRSVSITPRVLCGVGPTFKSRILKENRDDILTDFALGTRPENDYDDEDYYEEENDEQQEVTTAEEKQKEEKTTINAPPTVVPEKKKVVATKKPATKKLATKKPVAKKTAKKSTKKTAVAGKKKKVAPKKVTKAKKPAAKEKPTAKKATKKKKPVAKKSASKK